MLGRKAFPMPIKSNIEPILYTVAEAAKLLRISERTLWELTKNGLISCVRIGRRVLYDLNDLREFVNSHKEVNHAPS